MAGGYGRAVSLDEYQRLTRLIQDILDRLKTLERPTGTQTAGLVRQLQDAVDGLVNAANITITGDMTAGGRGTFTGGLNSVDVYSRLVTGSGSFRTTSTNILGDMGQTVSSARFKQDIETASIDIEQLRALRPVFFRYIANVPFDQEQQPLLLGLIAEEVHAAGLQWLVIYDEEGAPLALQDFSVPFLGLLFSQLNDAELVGQRAENAELRGALADLLERVEALEGRA